MPESRAIPKPVERSDWLDLRRPYIGASEALAVIGRHDYITPAELLVRKRTGVDQPQTKAMARGLTLESGVARLWEEEKGIALLPCEYCYQRGPFIATPDFVPVGDASWGVEVKTTSLYIMVPLESWRAQCYVQAYCAGWDRVELAVLDATMSLKCFTVDCTTDQYRLAIEELEAAATRFLEAVESGEIPEDVVLNEWAVKALFPRSTRNAIDLGADGLAVVQELIDARELRLAAEKREQAAKDELAALMVDADTGTYEGIEVLSWRNAKDGMRVDWKELEAENPDLVARYKRIVPGARVMRPTKEGREAASAMPWARTEQVAAEEPW